MMAITTIAKNRTKHIDAIFTHDAVLCVSHSLSSGFHPVEVTADHVKSELYAYGPRVMLRFDDTLQRYEVQLHSNHRYYVYTDESLIPERTKAILANLCFLD